MANHYPCRIACSPLCPAGMDLGIYLYLTDKLCRNTRAITDNQSTFSGFGKLQYEGRIMSDVVRNAILALFGALLTEVTGCEDLMSVLGV